MLDSKLFCLHISSASSSFYKLYLGAIDDCLSVVSHVKIGPSTITLLKVFFVPQTLLFAYKL